MNSDREIISRRQFAVADQFYKLHTNPYADEATKAGHSKLATVTISIGLDCYLCEMRSIQRYPQIQTHRLYTYVHTYAVCQCIEQESVGKVTVIYFH